MKIKSQNYFLILAAIVGLCATCYAQNAEAQTQAREGSDEIDSTPAAVLDTIEIPDDSLEACIRRELRKLVPLQPTDPITDTMMLMLTSLECPNKKIKDLTGLQYAKNLGTLKLNDNEIEDISHLAALTKIKVLYLYYNYKIKNISSLQGMTLLENLHLSRNQIASLEPLRGKVNLKILRLRDNEIVALSPLDGLSALETLDLGENLIEVINPLNGLTKLKSLWLDQNQLANDDLENLYGLDSLTTLNLGGNANLTSGKAMQTLADSLAKLDCDKIIWDHCCGINECFESNLFDVVRETLRRFDSTPECINKDDIAKLKELIAKDKGITKLEGLNFAANLEKLFLQENEITDLAPIDSLKRLKVLHLDRNPGIDISLLAELDSLLDLSLDGNAIRDISVINGFRQLARLSINTNAVTDIEALRGRTSLQELSLRQNQISHAEALVNSPQLRFVDLGRNRFKKSDGLANKSNLTKLYLDHNELDELSKLSGLTALTTLRLDSNKIGDEDLRELYRLDALDSLNLSFNTALTDTGMQKLADNLDNLDCDGIIFDRCCGVESYFREANLRERIRVELTKLRDSTYFCINRQDIEKLSTLDASGLGISEIDSIELAKNLRGLNLKNNDIANLAPLSRLRSLDSLRLDQNHIRNITPLETLTSLTRLYLENNTIDDLFYLRNLINLRSLSLKMNALDTADLRQLYKLDNLESLDLSGNPKIRGAAALPAICELVGNLPNLNLSRINWDHDDSTKCQNSAPIAMICEPPEQSVYKCDSVRICVVVRDDDEDLVKVKIVWGDGGESDFPERMPSGTTFRFQHLYQNLGSYKIEAIAEDGLVQGSSVELATVAIVDQDVAPPAFSPPPDTFLAPVKIQINTPTTRGTIHYTLDGRDPTRNDPSILAGDSLQLPVGNPVIKAAVFVEDCDTSEVVSASYRVLLLPKITAISAPSIVDVAHNVAINALVESYAPDFSAFLLYRRGGDSQWFPPAPMIINERNDTLKATIPGSRATSRGLEFSIEIKLKGEVVVRAAESPQAIRVRSSSLTYPRRTSNDEYQMISIPNDPVYASPESIFVKNLGVYDKKDWRLFRWDDNNIDGDSLDFREYTVDDNFDSIATPGKAFWLITKEPKPIVLGPTISVTTASGYSIRLKKGWNQIGNPFNFPVDWSKAERSSREIELVIHHWDSSGYNSSVGQLEPWEGYFLKSNSPGEIIIPPQASTSSSFGEMGDILKISENDWLLQITVNSQSSLDRGNYMGLISGAAKAWDEYDFAEPPLVGNYVSAYFPHRDWEINPGKYAGDFRAASVYGEVWDFEVRASTINEPITIAVANVWHFPSSWTITLHDETGQSSHRLGLNETYRFYPVSVNEPHRFKLVVGVADFDAHDRDFAAIPAQPKLFPNYPNPFNPETRIQYAVPADMFVALKVYDLTGREIRKLVEAYHSPGIYTQRWNGRDATNSPVASGIYFIRMRVGKAVITQKMILQR